MYIMHFVLEQVIILDPCRHLTGPGRLSLPNLIYSAVVSMSNESSSSVEIINATKW